MARLATRCPEATFPLATTRSYIEDDSDTSGNFTLDSAGDFTFTPDSENADDADVGRLAFRVEDQQTGQESNPADLVIAAYGGPYEFPPVAANATSEDSSDSCPHLVQGMTADVPASAGLLALNIRQRRHHLGPRYRPRHQ